MKRNAKVIQMPVPGEEKTRQMLEREAPGAAFTCAAIVLLTVAVIVGVIL